MRDHHTRFGRRGLAVLAGGLLGMAAGNTRAQAAASRAENHWCGAGCGDLIGEWSLTAYETIKAADGYANPMAASRALAMMHIAMHDAANAAAPRFAPYALDMRMPGADPTIAAAAAAHDALATLYPSQREMLARELAKALSEGGRGAGVERGRALGAEAARAIVAVRADDGADGAEDYTPRNQPGAWRFTPGFALIAAPHWRSVLPFGLRLASQFRTPAPPSLTSAIYQRDLAEVRRLGGKASTQRSEDQTRYAHFWYEFSDIGWNRVARVVARDSGLNLWASARLFAFVNMAMADAYIAGWESKMFHDFWRPLTAIHEGGDRAWEPLLPTPPIQDHPSTHSALGAAAAEVMASLLGDNTPFAFTSTTALPEQPMRRFTAFRQAAEENADSRVMAGVHFRFACDAGLRLGERIGRHVVTNYLRTM